MDDLINPQPGGGVAAVDVETFEIQPGRADAGLILICDHACNTFPPGYGTLGLPAAELERHIAYDIGVGAVTKVLSHRLGVPAILTKYSRLLIDPNRGEDDPTLIMRISDGAVVPGNRTLSPQERDKRVSHYYRPYHAAIAKLIDQCVGTGVPPTLLSLHSFTEIWRGHPRPWHTGILWDSDERFARPMINALVREGDLFVGDNEPYTGRMRGDCMWQHGTRNGLAHAIIEIRQDMIRDAEGQTAWAERLQRILQKLPDTPGVHLNFSMETASA